MDPQKRIATVSFLGQNWSVVSSPASRPVTTTSVGLERCFPKKNTRTHDVYNHCKTRGGVDIFTTNEVLKKPKIFLGLVQNIKSKETITILCPGTTFVGEDNLKAILFLQYTPGSSEVSFGYIGKKRNCKLHNVYKMVYKDVA